MNHLLDLLKIRLPIIQAPMAGGIVSPEMVAAVAQAGGLGSLPLGYLDLQSAEILIKKACALVVGNPLSVNLFIPKQASSFQESKAARMFDHINTYRKKLGLSILKTTAPLPETPIDPLIDLVVENGIRIISFTFGVLDQRKIKALHQQDVVVIGTATTVAEGKLLQSVGCDAVIAQSYEAGGHRGGGFIPGQAGGLIGGMVLIPQLVDALDIPVIAAGGIMDGRGIVAALALGASCAQMGTAFLTCTESLASELHKKMLVNSSDTSTVITSVFTGKPVRGIKNKFVIETERKFLEEELLPYPYQHQITTELRVKANQIGLTDYASLWAGQGHRMVQSLTVADLMKKLEQEMVAARL